MIGAGGAKAYAHAFDFRKGIVVGDWYDDGWCTPYLRGNFDFAAGEYLISAQVWNPDQKQFAENAIVLRCGLNQIAGTGILGLGQQQVISARIVFQEPTLAVALSLRSSIEWVPPPPDQRVLGFVLLGWTIELIE